MLLPKLNYSGAYQWELPASKSLSNRWLIVNYLCGGKLEIDNLSQADDTMLLKQMLEQLKDRKDNTFHCKNAGTVARFITALLATQKGTFVVTGDERMKQRPMAELLDALRSIGARIRCLEQEGFLPVEIRGTRLRGGSVRLSGKGSSQFASALLLVAQTMEQPLTIKFDNKPMSKAYISTTCEVLKACGHDVLQKPLEITVRPLSKVNPFTVVVENDWTSASYAYNVVAFSPNSKVFLPWLYPVSLQGDGIVWQWYERLGVHTDFSAEGTVLTNSGWHAETKQTFNCSDNPDLVLSLAVACAGLGIEAEFTKLNTLNFKESRRLDALFKELGELGCRSEATGESLHLFPSQLAVKKLISTYNDHRMVMSFATLACLLNGVEVENPDAVAKSFPNFFDQLLNPQQI